MPVENVAIGGLRHKIIIQERQGIAADSAGQRTGTWTTVATTRAKIEPISAREVERAQSFGGNTSHKVTIRYRPNLTRKMQVVFTGSGSAARTFLIAGILNPQEQNVKLELFCQELN